MSKGGTSKDTLPGRDANGNIDPNNWAGKHIARTGAEADRSQRKTGSDVKGHK